MQKKGNPTKISIKSEIFKIIFQYFLSKILGTLQLFVWNMSIIVFVRFLHADIGKIHIVNIPRSWSSKIVNLYNYVYSTIIILVKNGFVQRNNWMFTLLDNKSQFNIRIELILMFQLNKFAIISQKKLSKMVIIDHNCFKLTSNEYFWHYF